LVAKLHILKHFGKRLVLQEEKNEGRKNKPRKVSVQLGQGRANSGPRAKCGPPKRFQWPAEAFRKIFQSEISSNFS